MKPRTACLIAVTCITSSFASVSVVSGPAGAAKAPTATAATAATAKVPSVTGVWMGFEPPSSRSPIWMFILTNKPGSAGVTRHISGEFEAAEGGGDVFTDPGTINPSTGNATLIVGGNQPSVYATTNFVVKFVFKSDSLARTNHPRFSGTFDNYSVPGGVELGSFKGAVRAVRCSSSTSAKEIARCR